MTLILMAALCAYGFARACLQMPELAYVVLIIAPLAALQRWCS